METLTSKRLLPSLTAEQLLPVWQETLGIPSTGETADLEENFFDAGGTSLLAARLAGRIKAHFGCMVSAADVLSHPSVRQLAKKLSGNEAGLDRASSERRAAMQRNVFKTRRPERA